MEILRKLSEKQSKRKEVREKKAHLQRNEFYLQHPEFPHKDGCQRYNGLVRIYEVFVDPFNFTSASSPTGDAKCLDCDVITKLD